MQARIYRGALHQFARRQYEAAASGWSHSATSSLSAMA